ncbi:hypothetical protein ZTR_03032 [Talaromyces verruculosus]|nr:hypothetical protein ZTR_03032 [Talaromyces verruculosus]
MDTSQAISGEILYIPAQRSKGEILLFRRDHSKERPKGASDSGKAVATPTFAQDFNNQEDRNSNNEASAILQQSSVSHWNNLSYEVETKTEKKKILNNISGWVKPGTLTALMGVTGAGKTTLLDVLANRATFGTATGDVYIDDTPRDSSFQRKIGYVQQEDVHLPTTTVRETLEFAHYCDNQELDMESYAEAVVGLPGSGLNIEQRKTLSIGVEVAAKPELLSFLGTSLTEFVRDANSHLLTPYQDEPTSGLDSQTAWSIWPDGVLGDIGQDASSLIEYFESRGAPKCQPEDNPAECVLDVISHSRQSSTEHSEWSRKWNGSHQCRDVQHLFEEREGRSKTYPWTLFLAANLTVELCWQTIASVLIFVSWYYPTGLWRNGDASMGTTERSGLVFVLIWLFGLWITTFSQAVGVGIEHAETAVQIATLCFWLSLVFCGVLVSPNDLPRFWVFVYRVSPLTYFVDGMTQAALDNTHIKCSDVELLHIDPPLHAGSTCGEYLGPYIQYAGGSLKNPAATTDCQYCTVDQTNRLLQQLGMNTEHAWRNVGYMVVYVVFNVLAIYVIYWLTRVPKRGRKRS